jgi:hypothetical protein
MNDAQTRSRSSFARRGAAYFGMSSTAELIAAAMLFAISVGANVLSVLHRDFDSDEPYHVHVIWSWTRGLLQYRDVFDNHMPLFHLMFAPIAGLIGERSTILFWMRFLLLPMYFVTAWSTYRIGSSLFSRRTGVWAVLLLGFFSGYYYLAYQFRTDNLWTPLWMLCITALVCGEMTTRRAAIAGVLLGFCFAVSMKSILFLASIIGSFLVLALIVVDRSKIVPPASLAKFTAILCGTAAIVPGVVMVFFAAGGLWSDFRYQVFEFNLLAKLAPAGHSFTGIVILTLTALGFIYVARQVFRFAPDPHVGFRRAFVLLLCVLYLFLIEAFWPLSKTYLPAYPLGAILLSAGLFALAEKLSRDRVSAGRAVRFVPLPAIVALCEIFVLLTGKQVWKNRTAAETNLVRDVLTLTQPNDYVLDCKGETIFRRRCFRPLLERITRKAIKRGVITDDAPQRCIETRTCVVATILHRYSDSTREFIERAYLPVTNHLRVAGVILRPSAENSRQFRFEVVIPATYKIISRAGDASGVLDGVPHNSARFLDAGPHTFESTSVTDEFVLLWAQAVDRHFTPFKF